MTTATKFVVVELNKDLKLNEDNYEVWSMKIQYVLEEQEVLDMLNIVMTEPEDGSTIQYRWDREAYQI